MVQQLDLQNELYQEISLTRSGHASVRSSCLKPRRQSPHQQACPDGVQEFEVERCRTVAASASFDDFAGEYSVQGGSVRNTVPAEARLEGELRSLLAARADEVVHQIRTTFETVAGQAGTRPMWRKPRCTPVTRRRTTSRWRSERVAPSKHSPEADRPCWCRAV